MEKSILGLADSYKYSHFKQYPRNTTGMHTYMSSRGGVYPETVFLGLSYYIQKYLLTPVTMEEVCKVRLKAQRHGIPFDYKGWKRVVEVHGGLLPLEIRAIDEGSLVPTTHVLMTLIPTDPQLPWIGGFVETLLMKLWYPTTVATKSYYVRQMLERYGDPEWARFAYHMFGDRGATSVESAAIAGFAHYTQFFGTDNFDSLDMAEDYYGETEMPAYSVYATEHSTTTSNLSSDVREERLRQEEEFVYNQLLENPDRAIMSFVGDSTDIYAFTHFCTDKGTRIRELVESRPHQKFVIRPDSGAPIEVLNIMFNIMERNDLVLVPTNSNRILFRDFGVLWGDGITPKVIENILQINLINGFAAENFIFGSGGDIIQNVNRDTSKFAIKCSSITLQYDDPICKDGMAGYLYEERDVYKDPITDPGKASLKGKVTTWLNTKTGEYKAGILDQSPGEDFVDALETVFLNGKLVKEVTLQQIRERTS